LTTRKPEFRARRRLSQEGISYIIIPTALRDDYMLAPKGRKNNARLQPYFRIMPGAKEFTAILDYTNFDACGRESARRNAFSESEEARLVMKAV
jgi:hypothetical protein